MFQSLLQSFSIISTAECHENAVITEFHRRANTDKLKSVFLKYASIEKNGEKFMTASDFIQKYLGLYDDPNSLSESIQLLAGIADTTKDGKVVNFQINDTQSN